jgi:hypothetical protein
MRRPLDAFKQRLETLLALFISHNQASRTSFLYPTPDILDSIFKRNFELKSTNLNLKSRSTQAKSQVLVREFSTFSKYAADQIYQMFNFLTVDYR